MRTGRVHFPASRLAQWVRLAPLSRSARLARLAALNAAQALLAGLLVVSHPAAAALQLSAASGPPVAWAQGLYLPKRKRPLQITAGPKRTAVVSLASLDRFSEMVSVRASNGEIASLFIDDHTRFVAGNQLISFLALRPGMVVSLTFFQVGNALVADEVRVLR